MRPNLLPSAILTALMLVWFPTSAQNAPVHVLTEPGADLVQNELPPGELSLPTPAEIKMPANQASISQSSDLNIARISQTGTANIASIAQTGNHASIAIINQQGDGNRAAIYQH